MTTWFTADTHFGHANIIRHCDRPFASIEEMDDELIRRINERVSAPINLDELAAIMARKSFRAVDHQRSLTGDVETSVPGDAGP